MNIDQLKEGDVLVFEAGNHPISKAIAFLTDSNVSHAAMFFDQTSETIVEQSPPQVRTRSATEAFSDRKIYVRRLQGKHSMGPVLEAAKSRLNQHEPYDRAGMILLGLLLIYKKVGGASKARIRFLRWVAGRIISYLNNTKFPDKRPSVCSQFVAQCFEGNGKDYEIRIRKGDLLKLTSPSTRSNQELARDGSLLDLALEHVDAAGDATLEVSSALEAGAGLVDGTEDTSESLDELAADVLAELREEDRLGGSGDSGIQMDGQLAGVIASFALALDLEQSPENTEAGQPLSLSQGDALNSLKTLQSQFITPADLLKHATNLDAVGEIDPQAP